MQLNTYNVEAYLHEHLDPIGIPYHVDVIMYLDDRLPVAVVNIAGITYPELRNERACALVEMVVLDYKREYLKETIKAIYGE